MPNAPEPRAPDTSRTPDVDRDADKPDRLAEQERQRREREDGDTNPEGEPPTSRRGG